MSRWADEVDEEERRSSGKFSGFGGRSVGAKPHPAQSAEYADHGSGFNAQRYNDEPGWRERQYRAPQGSKAPPRGFHAAEDRHGASSWRSSQPATSHAPESHGAGHRTAPSSSHRPPDPAEHPAVNTSKPIKILKRQTSESLPSTPASSSHASSLPEAGSAPGAPPPIRTEHGPPAAHPHELPPGYESRTPNPAAPAPTPPRHPNPSSPSMQQPPPNWHGGPPPMPVQAPTTDSAPSTPTAADIAMLQMQQQQQYMQMQQYMQYTLQMQQAHYQNALLQQKQYYEALLQQMQAAHASSSSGGGAAGGRAGGGTDADGAGSVEGEGDAEAEAGEEALESPGHDSGPPGFSGHAKALSDDSTADLPDAAAASRTRKVKQGFQAYAPPTARPGGSTPPPGGLAPPDAQGSGELGPVSGPLFQPAVAEKPAGAPGSGGSKSRFRYSEDDNPSRIVASMHDDVVAGLAGGRGRGPRGGVAEAADGGDQGARGDAEWAGRGEGNKGRGASGSRQGSETPRQQAAARTKAHPPEDPATHGRASRIRTGGAEPSPAPSGSSTPPPGGFRKGGGSASSARPAANGARPGAPPFTPPRAPSFATPRPAPRADGPASAFAAAALRAALPSADSSAKGTSAPPSPASTRGSTPPRTGKAAASPRRRRGSRRSSSPRAAVRRPDAGTAAAAALNGTSPRGGGPSKGAAHSSSSAASQQDGPPGFGGSDAVALGDGAGSGRKPRGRPPRVLYAPPKKLGGPEAGSGEPSPAG